MEMERDLLRKLNVPGFVIFEHEDSISFVVHEGVRDVTHLLYSVLERHDLNLIDIDVVHCHQLLQFLVKILLHGIIILFLVLHIL